MEENAKVSLTEDTSSSLRHRWSEERAYRTGRGLSWAVFFLTFIAIIMNLFFAGVPEVVADGVLIVGCLGSLYLTHRRKSERYFVWWPLYVGFLIAIIPSTWFGGGVYSPWLGMYLAVLIILGSVIQTRVSPYFNLFWLIIYLGGWTLESVYFPQPNPASYIVSFPPIFMAVSAGVCLTGIGYCLNSLIRTERTLSLETEQRYSELFQARAHLLREESANQAKSTFLANISHELRTPLGAVLGYAGLLQDPAVSAEDKLHFAQTIERNGRQLARLVDDLLDLSKVEAGRIELEHIKCPINELLSDVLHLLEVDAKKKNLPLSVKMLTPVPESIVTDPVRFKQIFTNILGNAIKFTEHGQIEVLLRFAEGELHLTVKDSGRGIALNERGKLFKPFSQADASMTRRYGGTGLGLNFSRELARLLGGDLDLTWSRMDVGSEFTVHLPVQMEPETPMMTEFHGSARARRQPPQTPAFDFSGLSILVVDDAVENRDIIGRFLTPTGATIEDAVDGLQCVQKAETRQFDLILMDIQMPVLDGLQATGILRQKLFSGPIIAITAHAMKEDRDRCLKAGCDDHIAKPIKKQELMQLIDKYRPKNAAMTSGSEAPPPS